MKKLSIAIILGFVLGFCVHYIDLSHVYATDATVSTGAIIDSGTVQSLVVIESGKKGSIVNKGSATVFINWDAGTVTADTTAANKKAYLEANDSLRVPSNVKRFTHATSVGTAKIIFVED